VKKKKGKIIKNRTDAYSSVKWFNNVKIHKIIIFFFAIVLYTNTLFNEYAQDDAIVITDNMFTQKGFSGISGILTKDTFFGFFKKSGKSKLVSGGRYRPLSLVTFAIEYQFFGANPHISHVINFIIYGLLGLVLYKLLLLLFINIKSIKFKELFAFLTTLVFIGHPVHTEVVANVKGRDELLALLFSLLALYYAIKWLGKVDFKKQGIIFSVFVLALFSKENSITYLAIVPLVFFMFFSGNKIKYLTVFAPFFLAAIFFLVIRTLILGFDFGGTSLELMNNPFLKISGNKFVPFSFGEKLATIIFTLGKYIQLLFFPHPLTNDYYPRHISMLTFVDWKVILSLIVNVGLLLFALVRFKRNKILSFAILYYFITLSIVSNVVFPVGTNMSERFLFMPSLGFSLVIGYLFYVLFNKYSNLSFIAVGLVLLLFSVKTISRNRIWKNDFVLFTEDVKVSSNSAKALNAAGGSLVDAAFKEKNKVKKDKMLNQAKTYLEKALKIYPNYKNAMLILGNAEYFLGHYEQAISIYEKTLKIAPDYGEATKNLGIAYKEAGKYFGEKKHDIKKSLFYLRKALELQPKDYETNRLNGVANAVLGDKERALEFFENAVKLEPKNAGAYLNLGNAYYNIGDKENGKKYHDFALKMDPEIFEKNK